MPSGRLHSSIGTVFDLTFYVYNQNAAVAIGETTNNPFFGIFQPQSGAPFSAASLGKPGVLVEGTSSPTVSSDRNISGVIGVDGISLLAGNQDESTAAANTPAETVLGTYALTSTGATDGSGTISDDLAIRCDCRVLHRFTHAGRLGHDDDRRHESR